VRLSVTLFLLSLAGAVYGASMIGRWAVGLVVLAYSLALGVFALLRDDAKPQPALYPVGTEEERFRRHVVETQGRRTA
jgi:hypothetical protein